MGKLIFAGDQINIRREGLPGDLAWCAGLNAEVIKVSPSGSVEVRLLNSMSETIFEIPEDCCKKVRLYSYEVTVMKIGKLTGVLATNAQQAMTITDRMGSYDAVEWQDGWPATDADLEEGQFNDG